MSKKKKNKYEELIKMDEDLTFDKAMHLIVNAPKKDVEKAIEDDKKKELESELDLEETE